MIKHDLWLLSAIYLPDVLNHHKCVVSREIQVFQEQQAKVALLDFKDLEAAGATPVPR